MTDAPTRAQRFAALVAPAAQRAGYIGHGSNARLARDTGMSESSVSRMLKGQAIPELAVFPALAEKVGVRLLDLLAEMGIPPESLQPLSESGPSQVGSPSISPAEAAERLGLSDPVGREMLIATIERLKRLEEHQRDDQSEPGDERGGAAAQM
ncbi:helix-turn-helix domain-containing protein [Streptomyces sp. OUCMDZ-4982]|uniref:helix-turn-helix domain-containing protein n=1 Tax=Streptomyces sp. OUCMDZ-4982 TaxID=2973090 RepID=UPI00215D2F82|nr:helix-turn-helix transcriptional regulator [Streptomyces sp. OUCMDZ-4982]MCR8946587.1 helix-turn-helix domain-containing protein [Streptomyces sp. OUCMDZ-4982]